jgi:putative ABC transport system permease protein
MVAGDSARSGTGVAPRGADLPAALPVDASSARWQPAWLLTARDFTWRWRRYAIACVACGLVLGLALLLSGIKAGFDNEIQRTLHSFGASAWLVARGSSGPFTAPTVFPASQAAAVATEPGVQRADPVALLSATAATPALREVNVVGVVPGGVGAPNGSGALALVRGEAIADAGLGVHVGERFTLNAAQFRVGAVTHGLTYFAGTPTIRISLAQAQRVGFSGQALASAVVTRGKPRVTPAQLTSLSNSQVASDLARPVAQAKRTITLIRSVLWVVAAGIIGAILYLTALDRLADFAVMKAIGVATRTLLGGLLAQAAVLALISAAVGIAFAAAISPAAGIPVEVPTSSYLTLLLIAIAVAALGSMLAIRQAVAIDPASAFGG